RTPLQRTEGTGLADPRSRSGAAPGHPRRSHPGSRSARPAGCLRGADRRPRGPRYDGLPHQPRPCRSRGDRRPRRRPLRRPPRPRRGAGEPQGAVPASPRSGGRRGRWGWGAGRPGGSGAVADRPERLGHRGGPDPLGRGAAGRDLPDPSARRRGLGPDAGGDLPRRGRAGGGRAAVRAVRVFGAVLFREVAERWLLLVGAEAVGFFPLLVPFLPGVQSGFSAEFRAGVALALCFTVAAVLAVTLGASVLAGELAEGRLGFYFSRPIAGWAVWAGKLAGVAVLSIGSALLVLLPTLVVDRRLELGMPWWMDTPWTRHVPPFVGILAAGCVLLLLFSHLVSSMVRSRSPWLLLDLGAALAAAALFWSIRQTLWREGAIDAFFWGLGGLVLLVTVAAAVASAVQVTRGRTDARRAHRLLSLTFWSGVGIATAAFAIFSHWVVDVSPSDLRAFEAVLSPAASTWIGVRGPAVHRGAYFPAFLFDTATGRSLKISGSPIDRFWWLQPVFSSDGSAAAWLEGGAGGYELKTLDLTRPGARPAATAVAFESWPDRMALSPHGRLLAAVHDGVLTVDDLEARRMVTSVPVAL